MHVLSEKDEIKRWLKKNKKTREWLAGKCGVGKQTVDKWLSSSRAIPVKSSLIIENLMSEEPQNNSSINPKVTAIAVVFTNEEYEVVKEAATSLGMTIEEFVRDSTLNPDSK